MSVNETFLRSLLLRLAPVRSAPAKFAPIMRLRWNTALARSAPARSAPPRSRRFIDTFPSAHLTQALLWPARNSASPAAPAGRGTTARHSADTNNVDRSMADRL